MVQAQVRRVQDMAMISRDEFIAGLDLCVEISLAGGNGGAGKNGNSDNGGADMKRAFELLNKTNQFNTTGKRWDEPEFRDFLGKGRIFIFSAKDKYSNYGIVGVICELNSVIEQMVMSCRVFGLDVEAAAVACIYEKFYLPNPVGFRFKKTEKNMPARNFLNKICSGGLEAFGADDNPDEIILKINRPPEFNGKISVLLNKV
jgi:FkbH-like protein